MKPQIAIDGCETTIWRVVPRQRATNLRAREFRPQPDPHGARFVPRYLGPPPIVLQAAGQQTGFELWTENEKLEVWLEQPIALEEIAAIDTAAQRLRTRAGATLVVDVTRKGLSADEYRMMQTERTLAAPPPTANSLIAASPEAAAVQPEPVCAVCGWRHDASFTQVLIPGKNPITLTGILPDIVACVHAAHEKGFPRLGSKDEGLLRRCGGYGNPCKAFHDLKQSAAYRALFDKSRRGFIALRGQPRKES